MKFRPLIWRNTHPYMLADRMEDITDPDVMHSNPKCDRTVTVYGYLRGTNLRKTPSLRPGEQMVLDLQDAPSTLADRVKSSQMQIFNESQPLLAENSELLLNQSEDEEDQSDYSGASDDEDIKNIAFAESDSDLGLSEDDEADGSDHDSQDDEEDYDAEVGIDADGSLKWKGNLQAKAALNFSKLRRFNLFDHVYNPEKCETAENSTILSHETAFDKQPKGSTTPSNISHEDGWFNVHTLKVEISPDLLDMWSKEEFLDSIRDRFVTGVKPKSDENADDMEKADENSDEEVYDDFEDLENPNASENDKTKPVSRSGSGGSAPTKSRSTAGINPDIMDIQSEREANAKRKEELIKKKFDADFEGQGEDEEDDGNRMENAKQQMARQQEMNRAEFENEDAETRALLEGYTAGTYVRIVLECMPCEFVQSFDADYPIIVGEVAKKLKITGTPIKVFKNTAFVKDMFSSSLEVAKFEGASLRTVSGIRGQVKKSISKPEGAFRATFEDKVLMSDIIFLRAWYPVKPKIQQSCHIITIIGQACVDGNANNWTATQRSKCTIELQARLPFASKPKLLEKQTEPSFLQRRAVVMEPHERKVATLIQAINTIKNDKLQKQKAKQMEKEQRQPKASQNY
ncbi:hypothetical protein BSLG_005960 [Batrachochytrium salamandrivorans]|nr:hypothetical protein BSLG_005960 [Batrachochytrium salamandrivorans]